MTLAAILAVLLAFSAVCYMLLGLRVATVKHAHHAFEIDHPGTDSFRHRAAGAAQVLVAGGTRWALISELRGAEEPGLAELLARLDPCDLVLVEGYKTAGHPKIETFRKGTRDAMLAVTDDTIGAVASDCGAVAGNGIGFHLDDTRGIADFIAGELSL